MQLDELYPYWGDVHQDLIETIEYLSEPQLNEKWHDDARSIRQIILHLVSEERFYVNHIIAGHVFEQPKSSDYQNAASLIEALEATRQMTIRVLDPLTAAGLRAVRTVPADPAANRPETNTSVGWIFWHVVESEIYHLGQIALRIEDGKRKNRKF
jgi:uncharacterized damage-inducible protein DinB